MEQEKKTNDVVETKEEMRKAWLKKWALGLGLVLLASLSVVTVACGGHKKMNEAMMRRMALNHVEDLVDDIGATDQQAEQFEAIASKIVDEAIALRRAHQADAPALLVGELKKDKPNREALHNALNAHFDQVQDFVNRSLDQVLDAYATLDDGQKQILLDKLAKHFENN